MKRSTLLSTILVSSSILAFADPLPEPPPEITPLTSTSFNLDWDGTLGNTYFIEYSSDLVTWQFMPDIKSGIGGPLGYGFNSLGDRLFLRLRFTDVSTSNALTDDFDNDGISNWDEVSIGGSGTNPFNPDTDGDGVPDGYDVNPTEAGEDDWIPYNFRVESRSETLSIPVNNPSENFGADGWYFASWTLLQFQNVEQILVSGGTPQSWTYIIPPETDSYTGPVFGSWPAASEDSKDIQYHGWQISASSSYSSSIYEEWYFYSDWNEKRTARTHTQLKFKADRPLETAIFKTFLKIKETTTTTRNGISTGNITETTSKNQEFVEVVTLDILKDEKQSDIYTLEVPNDEVSITAAPTEDQQIEKRVTHLLLPVEIQVRNPSGKWVIANELKVAKWEHAWDAQGQFRQDFIDTSAGVEIDRFRIRIGIDNLPEEYRKFYISSKGAATEYNDNTTEVVLTHDPGGFGFPSDGFVSKPMILVADNEDNKFNSDNIKNDQTHIVALGSDVEFKIKEPTGDTVAMLPVKKKGSINIKSYIVSPNGQIQEALVERAWNDALLASEVYSQIGLEVTSSIEFVGVPNGVDLSDGLTLSTSPDITTLGAEGLALLNAYATPNNQADVIGIYVDSIIYSRITASGELRGIAFPKGWRNADNFKRTFLATLEQGEHSDITWSHELGHILLNFEGGNLSNHFSEMGNLMSSSPLYNGNPYTDGKRLIQWQEEQIFKFDAIIQNN